MASVNWRRWDLLLRCWLARHRRTRTVGINTATGGAVLTADLRCGCHWHPAYGPVVIASCKRHD